MTSVIRTYGLFWDNTLVDWKGRRGRGGQPPKILGSTSPRERSEAGCVDFYGQVGFYALYDERTSPLYIGQTGKGNSRLGSRLRVHLSDELMGRWRYFSWFGLGWVPKGTNNLKAVARSYSTQRLVEILDPIEGVLINLVEPPLNLQRGNLKRHGIERYYQFGQYNKWIGAESPSQVGGTLSGSED